MLSIWAGCRAPISEVEGAISLGKWVEGSISGRTMHTRHFVIHSTLTDIEFEKQVPHWLEQAYAHFISLIPPAGPALPMRTFLFATRQQWERFTETHYPARWGTYSRIHSGGFTEGSDAVSFYNGRANTLATLLHEAWHQYTATNLPSPPPAWLNEGLACQMETARPKEAWGGQLVFTGESNPLRLNALRHALNTGRLFAVPELIAMDAGEVIGHDDSRLTQTYYAQVWALVLYLSQGSGQVQQRGFQRLLNEVGSGAYHARYSAHSIGRDVRNGDASAALFAEYFSVSPEELNSRYWAYLYKLVGFPQLNDAPSSSDLK